MFEKLVQFIRVLWRYKCYLFYSKLSLWLVWYRLVSCPFLLSEQETYDLAFGHHNNINHSLCQNKSKYNTYYIFRRYYFFKTIKTLIIVICFEKHSLNHVLIIILNINFRKGANTQDTNLWVGNVTGSEYDFITES